MEGTRVILDMDVLIDLLRGVAGVVDSIGGMEGRGYVLATTVINAFELFYGAYKSRGARRIWLRLGPCWKDWLS